MNLSQLYYFQKLAEVQHYSSAAKQLSISQPALSSAISSLEAELYVPLFQKSGRNVKLTDYGKEFYEYVTRCLRYIEQGTAVMKEYSNQISGSVNIGCIPTLLDDFLPTIIRNYHSHYDNTSFEIYHGMSKDVVEGIQAKKYDVGFCSKISNYPDLVFVPIYYQEIIAIHQDDGTVIGDSVTLNYFKNKDNIITYRESLAIGRIIKSLLKKNNIHAVYRYDDEISIGGIVSKFDKYAICANTPFLNQFSNLKKIHISDVPLDTRLIYMCYNKTALRPAIVESFMNYVVTEELRLP